ncbi:MAG: prepilin-type N-terminal cleavage/methylation domain-containing protein [Desulfobulbaceae bacterium]|nr:prepilin-type N-terminal cleavage/methylation domain-containing protein [Desulfobulbaceae bacterium]
MTKFANTIKAAGERGFTLLEVLAAVVILSLAYVAVLQSFSVSLRNIAKVEKSRTTQFEELEPFIRKSKFTGEVDQEEALEGIPFIEGSKYRLVEVVSENEELATLVMENAF